LILLIANITISKEVYVGGEKNKTT